MIDHNFYASPVQASQTLITHILEAMNKELERPFTIALSGGTTPATLFEVWEREYATYTPWSRHACSFYLFHISTFSSYIGGFMNENDRTILEQAIYEEMELTPELIRSIRTLCGVCLCSFVESKAFKIAIVPSADRSMDTCTVCQTRRGHDYVVMNR